MMSGNPGQASESREMSARTHQQEIRDLVLARYGNLSRASLPHRLRFHLKRRLGRARRGRRLG